MKPFSVLYEDNHLLAIEKPQGIPVQADSSGDEDILSLAKKYIKIKYNKPGNVYLGLVHRLDRPTGGVLLLARTSKAASRLSDQFRKKIPRKEYLAVVCGLPEPEKGNLHDYLYKNRNKNIVSVAAQGTRGARECRLSYSVEAVSGGFALVRILLETGRSHQIRVQFASRGYPLWGDHKYGDKEWKSGEDLALWSSSLTLPHPVGGEELCLVSKTPAQKPWGLFRL